MLNPYQTNHLTHNHSSISNLNFDSNSFILEAESSDNGNQASRSSNDNYNEEVKSNGSFRFWKNDTISCPSPIKSFYQITFEIIKAKAIIEPTEMLSPLLSLSSSSSSSSLLLSSSSPLSSSTSFSSSLRISSSSSSRKKFVLYTILIKRTPGLEPQPGILERRYSQFLILYSSLRKRFPNLMSDFPFPKKNFIGNFDIDLIRERSIAFENLLAYCLSITDLLRTSEFVEFLHNQEMKEVKKLLKTRQFEEASIILENAYFIEEKISLHEGYPNHQGFTILTLLITLLNATNSLSEAYTYGLRMKEMILNYDCFDHSELMVPLLILLIRLFWSNGKEKALLEQKLNQFKRKGIKVEGQPPLLELILKKDFTQLTSKLS